MGVEYRNYLIPRRNTYQLSADVALSLVAALRHHGWLLAEDSPALSQLYEPAKDRGYFLQAPGRDDSFSMPLKKALDKYCEKDLLVVWPVESLSSSGLRYPLDPLPFDDPRDGAECYYEVQLHFGHDFIYHTSEVIEPFDPEPTCVCGHSLEYYPKIDESDPFYRARLSASCPECGATFDPTHLLATRRDGWTGEPFQLQGGATYRFALVVDCGKFFGGRPHRFQGELKTLVEDILGVKTYEVPDFY